MKTIKVKENGITRFIQKYIDEAHNEKQKCVSEYLPTELYIHAGKGIDVGDTIEVTRNERTSESAVLVDVTFSYRVKKYDDVVHYAEIEDTKFNNEIE